MVDVQLSFKERKLIKGTFLLEGTVAGEAYLRMLEKK